MLSPAKDADIAFSYSVSHVVLIHSASARLTSLTCMMFMLIMLVVMLQFLLAVGALRHF